MSIFEDISDWMEERRMDAAYERGYEEGEAAAEAQELNDIAEEGFNDGYFSYFSD